MAQKVIWKFVVGLGHGSVFEAPVPVGTHLLSAQAQYSEIAIWGECDPEAVIEKREFYVLGTGHPVPAGKKRFLGTCSFHAGSLILHVYEKLG